MKCATMTSLQRSRALLCAGALASAVLLGALAQPAPVHAGQGGTFVFANPAEYDILDPHVVFDNSRIAVRLNLYDNLYRWVDNPPRLEPWLAENHTVSDDGLKYTFTLRDGITFHDGSEMIADDVVYSIERILALNKGAAALYRPIIAPGGTKALDKRTVEFNLIKRAATFMSTVPEIHIVNADLVKEHEKDGDWGSAWLSSNDAGSGSFAIDRYDPAVGIDAVRFKDHFLGWGEDYIDHLQLRTVREPTTQVLGLKLGDYHGLDGYLPSDQVKSLRDSENVQIHEEQSMRLFIFHMHNQRPPLDNVHVRRAISYAFDYGAFIDDILGGSVARNPAPVPNNLWGYPEDVHGYDYDLEKAKAELEKSGITIDRPLEIHTLVGLTQTEQAATILQDGLRRLGIESTIVPETWGTLSGKARQQDTTPDIWTNWISTFYSDPHNWVGEMYDSENWGTWKTGSWYKNPKVDGLIHEAYTATDQKLRKRNYEEAARTVVDEAGSVFIYNTKWFGPFNKNVRGLRFCPVGNGQDFRWVYFVDG